MPGGYSSGHIPPCGAQLRGLAVGIAQHLSDYFHPQVVAIAVAYPKHQRRKRRFAVRCRSVFDLPHFCRVVGVDEFVGGVADKFFGLAAQQRLHGT